MKHKLKQKQNQRITRITDKTLFVGADIAEQGSRRSCLDTNFNRLYSRHIHDGNIFILFNHPSIISACQS